MLVWFEGAYFLDILVKWCFMFIKFDCYSGLIATKGLSQFTSALIISCC